MKPQLFGKTGPIVGVRAQADTAMQPVGFTAARSLNTTWVLLSLVALVVLLAPRTGTAETYTRPMHFQQISLQDGLSQSTVMSILQDSQGFMWFATENGLNRYDGYSIRRYNRDRHNPNALGSDFIWTIAEDSAGNLWLATVGGGVARWDRRTDIFESFRHDPDNADSLASNMTRTLLVNNDGRIWIGTRENGLDLLDPRTGHVTHFRQESGNALSLSNDSVYVVYADRSGQVWIGTDGGLNLINRDTGEFVRYVHDPDDPQSLSDNRVRTVFEDHEGVLWVGTFDGGLNRLDDEKGQFTRFGHDPNDETSLSHDHVRAIFEDDRHRLWVGTEDGLNLLDRRTGHFARYQHDPADSQSLNDSYVMSLYQDRSGLLWVGTRAAGVSQWNPRSWSLGHYNDEWLSGANVTSFADDGAGRIWVGTFGDGLTSINDGSTEIRHYRHDPGAVASLSDDRVMSLLLDHDGMLWIGTMAGGLNLLNPATDEIQVFRHDPLDPDSLSADGIMALHEDSAGNIWIGTFGGGVTRLDRKTGKFRHYPHDPDDPTSLSNPRATAIAEDTNGAIWVATSGGGLNLLDPGTGIFRHFRHDPNNPDSLSGDTIYALHIDTDGNLWVGTAGDGLDRVDGSSRDPDGIRFNNISQTDGLPSNVIYGIHSDQDGNLWLSSNNGLTRFSPRTKRIKTFHRSHGLQGEEFNFGAHHRGADGKLYFGGANGFNAFYPTQLEGNTHVPPVVLTSLEKLNHPAVTDDPYELLQHIELGYQDDVVTFEFAALDFTAPSENRYAYRLEGFDRDWNDLGNLRRVTYTNLDASDYVFRVKAANSDGIWNESGLAISVRVAPAPWETWWAYAGYTSGLLLLLSLAWRTQRRKLRQKAEYSRRLESEVHDRTIELEERNRELHKLSLAKSDFLARMSHEIRTPMNGVLGMTELLLGTALDDKQHRFAKTVHNSAESLLEIINDILDFSKIEAGKLQLESLEFDLRDLVEETIDLLAGRATEKGLELICAAGSGHSTQVCGDPLRLRQVLVNLIGNAVKFTDKGEVVVRYAAIREHEDRVELRFDVTDTGVGISAASQALIFDSFAQEDGSTTRRFGGTGLGLAISKQLVELMGGELGVESAPGEGSTFWFTVSLEKAASSKPVRLASRSLKDLRTLIVDDNATNLEILEHQLAAWQVRTKSARTGEDALTKLRTAVRENAPYELAILDMQMPNMDGEALARAIRADASLSPIKLLLLSSIAADMTAETRRELSIDGYLTKPVRQSRLYETLSKLTTDVASVDEREMATDRALVPLSSLGGRLLLVEDNPVNQAVAVGMLNQLGCEVEVAANGRAAVERLASDAFDVVLMDCQMPVMDGFEATAAIRHQEGRIRRTPIVALTANAMDGDRERCLAAGMDDYLSKPFTLQSLHALLTRWLGRPATMPGSSGLESTDVRSDALIDRSALEAIRDLESPGCPDMLGEVIELYLSSSAELMGSLKQAFEWGDAEGVRQAAHALKSSSGNLGAVTFTDLCRTLEDLGRQDRLCHANDPYRRLCNLYPRVVSALQLAIEKKSA